MILPGRPSRRHSVTKKISDKFSLNHKNISLGDDGSTLVTLPLWRPKEYQVKGSTHEHAERVPENLLDSE